MFNSSNLIKNELKHNFIKAKSLKWSNDGNT